jgi:hypothetical protein
MSESLICYLINEIYGSDFEKVCECLLLNKKCKLEDIMAETKFDYN